MYWKYHLESGDHVSFEYEGRIVNGTVRGWLNPDDYEDMSFDDVEPSDFDLLIKSGTEEVEVNLADITDSVKKKDRQTDLPYMSEEFRLSGGI